MNSFSQHVAYMGNTKKNFLISTAVFLLSGFAIGLYLFPSAKYVSQLRPTTIGTYFFQHDYVENQMLKAGWAAPRLDGTPSIGPHAELAFTLDDGSSNDLELHFEFVLLAPQRKVEVVVNGTVVKTWKIKKKDRSKRFSVARDLWDKARPAAVSLSFSDTKKGTSPDKLQPGILLEAVTIRKIY